VRRNLAKNGKTGEWRDGFVAETLPQVEKKGGNHNFVPFFVPLFLTRKNIWKLFIFGEKSFKKGIAFTWIM